MTSLSLLLCKLSSKTKTSDSSHLTLCPVLLTWTEMALWGYPILMALLCSDILIFKVHPVSPMYVPPHSQCMAYTTPVFSIRGVGNVSLESDVFRVCLDVKATLTGSFLTDTYIYLYMYMYICKCTYTCT